MQKTAETIERVNVLQTVPRKYPGATFLLIATGSSLTFDDVSASLSAKSLKTVVVNDAFRWAPGADILYACDFEWWDKYSTPHVWTVDGEKYPSALSVCGERWTQSEARKGVNIFRDGLNVVKSIREHGLSHDPTIIHQGGSSSFQALNLVCHMGAARVILLGFDNKTGKNHHFFGKHPAGLSRHMPFEMWRKAYERALPDLEKMGVEVINCTRDTALEMFPKRNLQDVLSQCN